MNFVLVDDSVSSRIARVIQGRSDAAHDSAKKSKSALHDRRWSGRKRSDSPGLIGHNKSTNALSCVVRDTSSTGAKVELVQGRNGSVCDPADVPDRMTLVFITPTEQTEVACAIMWRSGRQLGVRYVGPFRTFAKAQRKVPDRRK